MAFWEIQEIIEEEVARVGLQGNANAEAFEFHQFVAEVVEERMRQLN